MEVMNMRTLSCSLYLVAALALIACDRTENATTTTQPPDVSAPSNPAAPPAARITGIELGNAISPDGRVASGAAKTTFAPSDTIYVSVLTDQPPAGATLTARWTFDDGQLVSEGRESLTSSSRSATEFHISKPDGWPAGRYKVEIAMNGQPAGTREFEVR
jgi:hypothetical protein